MGHNKTGNTILIFNIFMNGNNVTYWFDDCVDYKRELNNTYIKTTNQYITERIISRIIENN